MRITWTMMIALAIVLAGCATPEEQAARMEREMGRAVQIYGPACERLGYKQDTDPWRDCVLRLVREQNNNYYNHFPMTTTCFNSPGFLQCTNF